MEHYTYSVLIQKSTNTDNGKDEKIFFEGFHSAVRTFIETEREEKKKTKTEAIQRAIARLRASLVPYLSTPLKSDKDDIERSIKDTIEDILVQFGSSSPETAQPAGSYRILESGQIQLHRQLVGVIKRLLKNGKAMLADSGISTGKSYGTIFLSHFPIDEFSSVTTIHDGIEKTNVPNVETGYSLINDSIAEILLTHGQDPSAAGQTIILHFNAEEKVIQKLRDKLSTVLNQFGIKNIRLSKRVFFAGFGSQYQLQFDADLNKYPLGSILVSLIGDDDDLEDSLTTHGSMIVLEKIA